MVIDDNVYVPASPEEWAAYEEHVHGYTIDDIMYEDEYDYDDDEPFECDDPLCRKCYGGYYADDSREPSGHECNHSN